MIFGRRYKLSQQLRNQSTSRSELRHFCMSTFSFVSFATNRKVKYSGSNKMHMVFKYNSIWATEETKQQEFKSPLLPPSLFRKINKIPYYRNQAKAAPGVAEALLSFIWMDGRTKSVLGRSGSVTCSSNSRVSSGTSLSFRAGPFGPV